MRVIFHAGKRVKQATIFSSFPCSFNELSVVTGPSKVRIEHARFASGKTSFVPRTDYKTQLKLGDVTLKINNEEIKKPRIASEKTTISTLTEQLTRLFIAQKFDQYIVLETVNSPLVKNGRVFVTVCDGIHKAHFIAPELFVDILSGDEPFRVDGFTAGFVTNLTGATAFTITASEEILSVPEMQIEYTDEHEIIFPPVPQLEQNNG